MAVLRAILFLLAGCDYDDNLPLYVLSAWSSMDWVELQGSQHHYRRSSFERECTGILKGLDYRAAKLHIRSFYHGSFEFGSDFHLQ